MQPLPEDQVLSLPAAGLIATGPGVPAARQALERAHRAGLTESQAWTEAALAVKAALDDAVAQGARGQVIRPLERLRDACTAEAAARP